MAGAPGDGARQNSCRAAPTRTAYPSSSVGKQNKYNLVLVLLHIIFLELVASSVTNAKIVFGYRYFDSKWIVFYACIYSNDLERIVPLGPSA